MEESAKGQVSTTAAKIYEAFYLPALFQEWAARVCAEAELSRGKHVLDVGCGTGVLAREALGHVSLDGRAVGLDINEGMLAVARSASSDVDWKQGQAEALPFENAAFDAVISQFGLMFFEDRVTALKEMWRVLRPGGRLVVAVWDILDRSPGYAAIAALLRRLFGEEIADAILPIFSLGEKEVLSRLFDQAGVPGFVIRSENGSARFPSIESWVYTDIKGWTLADVIDDEQYERLLQTALLELMPFEQSDGSVLFNMPAHIVSASKA